MWTYKLSLLLKIRCLFAFCFLSLPCPYLVTIIIVEFIVDHENKDGLLPSSFLKILILKKVASKNNEHSYILDLNLPVGNIATFLLLFSVFFPFFLNRLNITYQHPD